MHLSCKENPDKNNEDSMLYCDKDPGNLDEIEILHADTDPHHTERTHDATDNSMNDISGADPAASSDADNHTDLEDSEDTYHPKSEEDSQSSASTIETDDTPQPSTSSNSTPASRSTAEIKGRKGRETDIVWLNLRTGDVTKTKHYEWKERSTLVRENQMLQGEKQPEVLALLVLHRLVSN